MLAYRRPRDGKSVKISIGSTTERISLAKARAEARDLLALLRREPPVDPAEERKKRREQARAEERAIRFSSVLDAFAETELPTYRPTTRAGWQRYITAEIKPALGHLKPEEVSPEHIAEMVAAIAHRAPTSGQRAFEVVRRVMAWASTTDPSVAVVRKRYGIARLEVNPCAAARPYRAARHRNGGKAKVLPFTNDQIRAIFQAAQGRRGEHLISLIAYCGTRDYETRSAQWSEFDQEQELWTIPASKSKTGDLHGKAHLVPLSDTALRVLASIREDNMRAGMTRSPYLFPAVDRQGNLAHMDKANKITRDVKKAAGITDRGLLHRWRHTISTRLSEHGTDPRAIEHILGHVVPGVAGVYNHAEMMPQRQKALEWWSEELDRIVTKNDTGKAQKRPARR